MARAQDDSGSLRFGRRESARLAAALVLSLLVHLCVWGGYHLGHNLGLLHKLHAPDWLIAAAKKHLSPPPPPPQTEEPTTFVDVSHADADAPVKPKYYSYQNSHAANPVEGHENNPEMTGKQTVVPKTEDVEKVIKKSQNTPENQNTPQVSKAQPLMPSPSPSESKESPQTPGETELLKKNNDTKPSPNQTQPPQERPRTIKQALAQRNQLPGQMMQQPGGVSRHALVPAFDAKQTPFGEYDRALIEAIQQHWDDLLDNHRYADERTGKVTVQFKLKSDGTIIEMQIVENTVGQFLAYLCQDAIGESAPFAKWPSDMVREFGANYREVTFTFYYY